MKRYLKAGSFVVCVFFANLVNGQGLSPYNWYFGNSPEAIIFSKADNTPTVTDDQAAPYANTASAVATDPITGDLLFYSDGQNVYDATHTLMPLGVGLSGNPATNQGVAVSPVPGADTVYYIFTNNASFTSPGQVDMTIVDMTLFGNAAFPSPPLGDVVGASRNTSTPLTNTSEAMMVIARDDLSSYWLITQEIGTASYNVMEILDSGPGTVTNYDFSGLSPSLIAANFSYSPVSNRIAVAPQDTSKNVQILNFDPATGTLSFETQVFNSAVNDMDGQAIYDTEFSPTGNFLYISRHGGSGNVADILQFDINNQTTSLAPVLNSPVYRSYGLQTGPDSMIYHLYQENINNPFIVGRISAPDSVASQVDYQRRPFGNDDFVGRQFPATLPPKELQNDTITVMYIDSCFNMATKFFPNVIPRPDNYFWSFGDGNTSTYQAPIHMYQNPGNYTVMLQTELNGQTSSTSIPVIIVDQQYQADLGADTVICPGETLELNPGQNVPPGATYGWSTGETTSTITVDSAGYYWVVVTDPVSGCELYDAIQVEVYGEIFQAANVWYFGNEAGIDFNEAPPVALTDGKMSTMEGCAVISDSNGDLLFYTNGVEVYNRDHEIMKGGTELTGDQLSTQSAMIVQFADDETLYYIFTTQRIYGTYTYELNYSVVDMKGEDGLGEISIKNKPLFTNSTERITGSVGGSAAWVIAHEYGNNSFRAYPVDAEGIGKPVLSTVGSVHSFTREANGEGYMQLSPDGQKLAVALPGAQNVVELFDFDSTGKVSNMLQLEIPEGSPSKVYGVEFSSDGRQLYASVLGSPSRIYHWEIDSTTMLGTTTDPQYIIDSRTEVTSENEELGALQRGPNGQIYVAVNGSGFLGTISNPEVSPGGSEGFLLEGFNLDGKTSALGLPNFAQNVMRQQGQGSATSSAPACIGSPVTFQGTPTSSIDEFLWTFGDGNSSIMQIDSNTYDSAGLYNAALQLTNRCGLDTTITLQVNVFDNPPAPTFSDQMVICGDDLTIDALPNDDPGLTYGWSTGDSTRSITVNQQGIYSVTISNQGGCTSSKETFAADAFTLDLGPDQTICQNSSFPVIDTQVPQSSYTWTVNGNSLPSTQTQTVDTTIPGTYEYIVEVTESITLCTKHDTVVYTITPEPVVNLVTTPSPGCGNDQGQIDIDIQTQSIFSYFVSGPTTFTGTDIQGPTTTPVNVMPLPVGTYSVGVTDLVDGCSFNATATIEDDAPFTLDTVFQQNGCGDLPVDVQTSGIVDLTSLQYAIVNNATSDTIVGPKAPSTMADNFETDPIPEGTYSIEVSADGCTRIWEPLNVVQNPKVDASVQIDNCASPNTAAAITSISNPAFLWQDSMGNILSDPEDDGIVDITESGDYTLTVSDLDGALCDSVITANISVVLPTEPAISIDGDECEGQVTLTSSVTPSASYIYQWIRDGVAITNANTPSHTVTTDGDYQLRVINQSTGCDTTTVATTVDIKDPVEVTLTSDAFCDTGEPFTVVANITSSQTDFTIAWFRNNNIIPGETQPVLEAVEEGTFRVEVETSENCTASDKITITLTPYHPGELPNRVIICPEDTDPEINSALLDPGPNFVQFTWKNGNGQTVSMSPTFTATVGDTYSVDLINAFGCPATDSTEVIEDCIPKIYGPNAFKPTGTNKEFFLFTEFVDEFQIFIFNRWGELIYQSDSKDFRWSGRFNGRLLPAGTYAYTVRYTSKYNPGVELEQHGGVILLR